MGNYHFNIWSKLGQTFLENFRLSSMKALSLGWKVLILALTCREKENSRKSDGIKLVFQRLPSRFIVSQVEGELSLTGLKITSSSRVMLPFHSLPKSSFFSM